MAIGIRVKKVQGEYNLGVSKFFGTPTIPSEWTNVFFDDEIFFCQIRLSDIEEFDKENELPHTGYLYVFLHTENGDRNLEADVRCYDGQPTVAFDGFNESVEGYEHFNEPYLMEFFETDVDADCTRLLGMPSDWNYEEPAPKLLLQFDPLDSDMGFLNHLDGFVYFFFGEDEKDFKSVTVWEEYS